MCESGEESPEVVALGVVVAESLELAFELGDAAMLHHENVGDEYTEDAKTNVDRAELGAIAQEPEPERAERNDEHWQ